MLVALLIAAGLCFVAAMAGCWIANATIAMMADELNRGRPLAEHVDALGWPPGKSWRILDAYGRAFPEFWVGLAHDGKPASVGTGTHIGFLATSKEQVHAFYDAAIAAGAKDDGKPGPRPEYGAPYYGCFVRDLDGHKIEAAFWDEAAA